jgi:lipopolysaccharide transport system permease protein
LWITIGLGVQIAAIGVVFGLIFGADLTEYLPFLGISLVLWAYLVSTITDATNAYVQSQQVIKQIDVPSYLPIVRVLGKNSIIFAHNLSLVALIMVIFVKVPGREVLMFIPGLAVVIGVMFALSTMAGIVSARYRDLPPIIGSVLTVSFYLTPIIWMPATLPELFREPILSFNPFFHLMELIRAPLLGTFPSLTSWLVGLGLLLVLGVLVLVMSRRYAWKIVYWL